ncbi:MAG: DegT/DnrJ/EryC1/StrS aminotransferase family protein [Chitinophagales bacterium]|nr:DegT/DnrJ/EryC1/StrS aminotransferase family protein [Bacteroidota bacterium]
MNFKYPVYQPNLSGNEKKYVLDCLDSTWISSKGSYINKFESAFAQKIGVEYAASVCNGTVALHLSLVALGIGEGDEVIVPTLTYIASVNCIVYAGAKPVFVDANADTWQMDPEDVKRKITAKTKAILCVHLYGQACDMKAITQIANEHQLYVIEDCAEALGTKYNNQHVGTFSDIATFSFFGNKTITTGEGGMVVTNNETLYDRLVHYKGQGLAKHREYWHDVVGYNYRMTNICAAIGLAQLERFDELLEKKQQLAKWYKHYLKDIPVTFHEQQTNTFHSYWMCSVLVNNVKDREPLREFLKANGIETRPLFYPVHTMPMYTQHYQMFPVAENLGWRGINLPSYPDLKEEDIAFICKQIVQYFNA